VRPGLDIDCQDLVELVTEYLEGTLPPELRRRFEDHLALCEGCDTYVEQMRETIRLLGQLTEETLSPQASARLLEAFRTWRVAGA
jgi:anti-sigma factor RsiW